MASETAILKAFGLLAAGGKRRPKEHDDRGMVEVAVGVYASILADVSDDEVGAAVKACLSKPDPWWPAPGELRELVPGMVESDVQWKLLQKCHGGRWVFMAGVDHETGATITRATIRDVKALGGLEAVKHDGGARLRHAIRSRVAPLQIAARLPVAALEDKAS